MAVRRSRCTSRAETAVRNSVRATKGSARLLGKARAWVDGALLARLRRAFLQFITAVKGVFDAEQARRAGAGKEDG